MMSSSTKRLVEACRKGMNGDEQALDDLGLLDSTFPPSRGVINCSAGALQRSYQRALFTAVAAKKLSMAFLEQQSRDLMDHIVAVASFKDIRLEHSVDSQDVAEIMLALLHEEEHRINAAADKEEEEEDDNKDASDHQAATNLQATDDEPKEDQAAPSLQASHETKEDQAATNRQADQPTNQSAGYHQATEQEEPEKEPQDTRDEYAKHHNKRRQCPLCDFFGTHLRRHVSTKHPDRCINNNDVTRQVAIADKRLADRGSKGIVPITKNKNEYLYQCCYKDCSAIVTRMGQHLSKAHKLTDQEKVKAAKAKFIRLNIAKTRKLGVGATQAPSKKREPSQASLLKKQPSSKKREPSQASLLNQPPSKKSKPAAKAEAKRAAKKTQEEDVESEESSETDATDEIYNSEGDSDDDVVSDHGELKVLADLDDMSDFADSDEEEEEEDEIEGLTWKEWYEGKDRQRNVHKVINALDAEGDDLTCLIRNQCMDIWEHFCAPRLRKKVITGNTIKTYLRSLEIFAKFVEKGLIYNPELISTSQKQLLISLQTRLPDYKKAIHRRTAHETTTRDVDESYTALEPKDLRELENSELAKTAIKLIGLSIENHVLTRSEFTTVRDFLIVTTLYENASRPGPLENAKLKRFHQAVYTPEKKRYTILVDEHKTTRHQGPAELTVDERLYGYLKIYVDYIRPAFVASGIEEALFIKDDGQPFNKGTIGRRVSEFFKRAGVRDDIRVSSTKVRKLFSGEAFNLTPTKKRMVNSHMKHRETTADKNYVLKVNAKRSATAHEIMRDLIRENNSREPEGDKPTKASPEPESKASPEPKSKASPEPKSKASPEPNPNPNTKALIQEQQDESEEDSEPAEDATSALSNDDRVVVASVFTDTINAGKHLSLSEIRDKMRTAIYLRKFVINQRKVKKIYDFVRYKTSVAIQTTKIQVTDPYDFDGVKSLPSSSLIRKQWREDDVKCINQRFKHLESMPSKSRTISMFNNDEVLQHILQREGKERCYEKTIMSKRRMPYTPHEDKDIIDYVRDTPQHPPRGNILWQLVENEGLTNHTWQSMRSHYLDKLIPSSRPTAAKKRKMASSKSTSPSSTITTQSSTPMTSYLDFLMSGGERTTPFTTASTSATAHTYPSTSTITTPTYPSTSTITTHASTPTITTPTYPSTSTITTHASTPTITTPTYPSTSTIATQPSTPTITAHSISFTRTFSLIMDFTLPAGTVRSQHSMSFTTIYSFDP
ncbi:hypothetical protein OS493_012361 [Desmophyllum pertusum]|uniref:TERF2-interacting telomeric protein 1 Myb domain-containing protein n=1 Tax=Desmophyllum pertusum TaxID=174260 RepID=A0A9W9ZQF2_9CNID|nr:hypothetical protein OS493_012361 [Desmophyllum pertusum]